MEITNLSGVKFLTSDKFSEVNGLRHGFSLRHGGISEGDYKSLNVGLRRGDDIEKAKKNIDIAASALGLTRENLTLTYQTHTTNVAFLTEADIGRTQWEDGVDGIVTDMKNVPLMCYSADCVPTLLCDSVRGMIGAVHGGWRGTAGNIIKEAVRVMKEHGSDEKNILAFIGPAIGMCCYEVSSDVAERFFGYKSFVLEKENGKYMLDLKNITKEQLKNAGLPEENIENSDICTSCRNEDFFSHRAQRGKSGLLGGFIELR